MKTTCLRAVLAGTWLAAVAGACAAQDIQWEVVNRFPVFRQAEHFQNIAKSWQAGSATGWVESKDFSARLRKLLHVNATAWHPVNGYDKQVLFPASHQVLARMAPAERHAGRQCTWTLPGQTVTSPCDAKVSFAVAGNTAFDLAVALDSGESLAALAGQQVRERFIVAIGDSFGSGEGNPDHPAILEPGSTPDGHPLKMLIKGKLNTWPFVKTGAAWWDHACHRSFLSWPALSALREAIENEHQVVQFASLACSGAEVYNGFFRAQLKPPGTDAVDTLSTNMDTRDGGADGVERNQPVMMLRYSQQHALADLVCGDGLTWKATTFRREAVGLESEQRHFGSFAQWTCPASERRAVDAIYVSLGGNDVVFSGVVKWLIFDPPDNSLVQRLLKSTVKRLDDVKNPAEASRHARKVLAHLYEDVALVLDDLGIERQRTFLLVYPDPTPVQDEHVEGCDARSEDGNRPFQAWMERQLPGSEKMRFGASMPKFRYASSEFIQPLRQLQVKTADALQWQTVDAQLAIGPLSARGYCAVAKCTADSCSHGDRVRWWKQPASAGQVPTLSLDNFDPYDAHRARGLRYAMDALLTSASLSSTGVVGDWVSSAAHPTANIHARIADTLFEMRRGSRGTRASGQ